MGPDGSGWEHCAGTAGLSWGWVLLAIRDESPNEERCSPTSSCGEETRPRKRCIRMEEGIEPRRRNPRPEGRNVRRALLHPVFLFLIAGIGVFGLRGVGGIDYPSLAGVTVAFFALQMLLFTIVFSFTSALSRGRGVRSSPDSVAETNRLKIRVLTVYTVASLLSILWLVVASLDLYSNRSALAVGITAARFGASTYVVEGSMVGILKHMTLGFPVVLVAVVMLYPMWFSKRKSRLAWALFSMSILYGFLEGGRNPAFTSVVMLTLVHLLGRSRAGHPRSTRRQKGRVRRRVLAVVGLTLIVSVFVWFFLDRADYRGRNAQDDIENIVFGFGEGGWASSFANPTTSLQVYTMLNFYATHSINEVNNVIVRNDGPFYGAYSLYLPAALLSRLGLDIPNARDVVYSLERQGVYLGLSGSLFLDFGYYGTLLAFGLLGWLSARVHSSLKKRIDPVSDLLGVWVLSLLALSFFYAIFSVGNGLSILIAVLSCAMYCQLGAYRIVPMNRRAARALPSCNGS